MSEQIRREIEHFQQRLDFAGEDEHLKRSIRESIAHLRRKCLMVESLESFRSILRPAHAQILEMLSEQINQNISDHLLRRSYVISFFGTVCSALLDRPAYSHMKAFFPSLKLPLLISDADRTIFRTAFYRNVSLKNCVKNFLLDYKVHLFKVRREENLRSLLWAPILQSFICSLKREFVVDELDLALEYNFKDVVGFVHFADEAIK